MRKKGPRPSPLSELSAKFNAAIPRMLTKSLPAIFPWTTRGGKKEERGGKLGDTGLSMSADPLHISLPLYSFLKTFRP